MAGRVVEHLAHRLVALAHRQAAQGVAVEADLAQPLGRLAAQRLGRPPCWMPNSAWAPASPNAALERAPQRAERRIASRAPRRCRQRDQLVELHDDVGAQQVGLDLDRPLGRQHVARAVDVALEGRSSSVTLEILDSDITWKPPLSRQDRLLPAP
jgi:hypothetical protein